MKQRTELTGRATRADPVVVGLGIAGVLAVLLWGVFARPSLATVASGGLDWVIRTFGWLFVVAADAFLVLAVVIALTRFGRIRLGAEDDEPEFSTIAWVSMMFSTGMGIGLIFYAVAEPIQHYAEPPPGTGIPSSSGASAAVAMQYTLFHWTLHPWAIYAIAGLALAYSTFRKGRGNTVSAAFHPLLGDRVYGAPGRAIDLLAIFATVFGSATSLGLGALQIAAGLGLVTGIAHTTTLDLIIIGALTGAFVVSALSGLHRGVKWLSNTNVALAVLLMLFVFVTGPTIFTLEVLPAAVGDYLDRLLVMSTRTGAFSGHSWLASWTIFYWAWWISWAPFVGTFIARISRGRTVREFVAGVLLVPSGASVIWFAIIGGTALRVQATGAANLTGSLDRGLEYALFGLLDALPLAAVTSVVAVILVALYFVTGADSASLVLGSLSSRGTLRPHRNLVMIWGILIGAVAAVLLLVGGLEALQQMTILVALPFVIVMLLLAASLLREMAADPMAGVRGRRNRPYGLGAAVRAARAYQEEDTDPHPVRWFLGRRPH